MALDILRVGAVKSNDWRRSVADNDRPGVGGAVEAVGGSIDHGVAAHRVGVDGAAVNGDGAADVTGAGVAGSSAQFGVGGMALDILRVGAVESNHRRRSVADNNGPGVGGAVEAVADGIN